MRLYSVEIVIWRVVILTRLDRFTLKLLSMPPLHNTLTLNSSFRLLQHDNPALASKYFVDTAEFFASEERPRDAGNAMKDAVRMLCRAHPRK